MVVMLFATRLGATATILGLIATLGAVGVVLPQLLVAGYVCGRGRVMPLYRRASMVRVGGVAWMALATVLFAGQPGAVQLGLFVVGYALYVFASGISSLPFIEVVGRVIPARRRGTFFSLRQFGGGAVSLVTSLGTAVVISERLPGLAFPYNFGLLFGLGVPAAAITFWLWTRVREPGLRPEPMPTPARTSVWDGLHTGLRAARLHPDFKYFLFVRLLLTLAAMAGPFYMVYARQLDVPMGILGGYVTVSLGASMLSNLIWGPLVNRAGRRTLVSVVVLPSLAVPLAALLVPMAGRALSLSPEALGVAYALVFVLGGLGSAGQGMVFDSVLLSLASPAQRPTYFAFVNTLCGVTAFLLPVGGVVVDLLGYNVLFGLALALGVGALFASTRVGARSSPAPAQLPPRASASVPEMSAEG
jgi:MFS family permease